MSQILQVAAIAMATVGTGAATMTVMKPEIADFAVPEGDWSTGEILDGQSYFIEGVDLDSGTVLQDEIIFRDGTFQSVNCQTYCDFGWSNYQTKVLDDVIHFTATTQCPDAPHTVVWYGTVVAEDEMQLDGTWTTRRWYWNHQIRFSAEGSTTPPLDPNVTG